MPYRRLLIPDDLLAWWSKTIFSHKRLSNNFPFKPNNDWSALAFVLCHVPLAVHLCFLSFAALPTDCGNLCPWRDILANDLCLLVSLFFFSMMKSIHYCNIYMTFFLITVCLGQLMHNSTDSGALKLKNGQIFQCKVWNVWPPWDLNIRPLILQIYSS